MSIVDYVCVSGSMDGRLLEYVDHLHEHFTSPVHVQHARYSLPLDPGYSARMHPESITTYRYPDGSYWRAALARN
jgi:L-fuconate dehydratase